MKIKLIHKAAFVLILLVLALVGYCWERAERPALSEEKTVTGAKLAVAPTDAKREEEADQTPAAAAVPAAAETLPRSKTISGVPFTSQAPLGDWADPRQQHGCEEASLIMVHHWVTGEGLSAEEALREILDMSQSEEKDFPGDYDLSLPDAARLYQTYFGGQAEVRYDISALDIKQEIVSGKLVIVPMDGTQLGNPHYTAPGPERHELVVIGYDDDRGEFITNDPGTKYGAAYRYGYDSFMAAVRDYATGQDAPIVGEEKGMLVIGRS